VGRDILLSAFMVALVYLARAGVLRDREVYADLAAARWGADPKSWQHGTTTRNRVFGSFAEHWRVHPSWELRKDSLADPAALFDVQALPMFMTGAASVIIAYRAPSLLAIMAPGVIWANQIGVAAVAGLSTAIASFTLWRAVAYSVLAGVRTPSGLKAGLWLGIGLVAGELTIGRAAGTAWLPSNLWFLLVLVAMGLLVTCWTTGAPSCWIRAWRGRSLRPGMLMGMVAGGLTFGAFFAWWQSVGWTSTGIWTSIPLGYSRWQPGKQRALSARTQWTRKA
jgi:hypothetical protein